MLQYPDKTWHQRWTPWRLLLKRLEGICRRIPFSNILHLEQPLQKFNPSKHTSHVATMYPNPGYTQPAPGNPIPGYTQPIYPDPHHVTLPLITLDIPTFIIAHFYDKIAIYFFRKRSMDTYFLCGTWCIVHEKQATSSSWELQLAANEN